jgi:hypothetical protein
VAGNNRRRDAVMRALIGLALSHKRLGNGREATGAMAELVRGFPDREISYKDYGPEPRDLYAKVVRDLAADGLGSLTVEIDDPRTVVFLDDRYVGVGTVTVADLYPGKYRVYLQQGGRPGRVHEVDVEAGGPTAVSLSWSLDAALRTEAGVAALEFADAAERRDHEARLAVRIGRALGAPSVALIGFRDVGGQRQVIGQVFYVDTRKEVRSATVSLDPVKPRADQLRALGRYLAGDESAARLVEPLAGEEVSGELWRPAAGGGRRFGAWKWITLTAGVAGLATGGVLLALDEDELASGDRNAAVRNTAPAGVATLAVGAALTGLAIYMLATDERPPARAVAVTPLDGGALIGYGGTF